MRRFLALALFVCWSMGAQAQQPASALDKKVGELVRQLGAKEFSRREAARKALLDLGASIIPILDRLADPADLETNLRLRKIRYQLIGYAEDLDKYLAELPTDRDELYRAELSPALKGILTAHKPQAGDLLLKLIQSTGHPLERRAVHALVHSIKDLTASQVDAYVRRALVLESRARPQFPQNVDARIGMYYDCRYAWTGWPARKDFELRTILTHYLDGEPHGRPYEARGPHGSTGWIRTKDLGTGRHTYHFAVDYDFTHQGTTVRGRLRSRDFTFTMLPASTPNVLIAPADPDVELVVRKSLRFIDCDPSKADLFLGHDHVVDPWFPQAIWGQGKQRFGLRVPTWKVDLPLSVDLCFEAEIVDAKTRTSYQAGTVILRKGKSSQDYLCPDDPHAFAEGRTGFVDVQVRLTPSYSQALSDPGITSYFPGSITSGTLRMKICREEISNKDGK